MFRKRTVFVIGAGASCELGLPAGDGLMTKIASALSANMTPHGFATEAVQRALIGRVSREHGHNWATPMARYKEAAAKIVRALPHARSIDTYLESQQGHPETVFLGKLAIAHEILAAERVSHLFEGPRLIGRVPDRKGLSASWYPPLARILTSGHRANKLEGIFENVSFIVFNYDRCLELFLMRMIIEYFDVDEATALDALKRATIVHAYGKVGDLLRFGDPNEHLVPFGGGDAPDLERVAESIKTYTESADSGTTSTIKRLVRNAEAIVFMGFGFLAQNLDLLDPGNGSGASQVFATVFGISSNDSAAIEARLVRKLGAVESNASSIADLGRRKMTFQCTYESGTCRNLMDNNIFSLADQ